MRCLKLIILQSNMRQCTSCGKYKSLKSGFYINGGGRKGYNAICKMCRSAQQQVYYIKHKAEYLARSKRYRLEKATQYKVSMRRCNLRSEYGISLEDYNILKKNQKGRCAICNKKYSKTLLVDHDHKTGRVRGLLCRKCNTGLGQFCDNPKLLWQACLYMENCCQ